MTRATCLRGSRRESLTGWIIGGALLSSLALVSCGADEQPLDRLTPQTVIRPDTPPFSADSYWNTPVGDAPAHPKSDDIINFLAQDNVESGCVLLSGANSNRWGMPIYWAGAGDPIYDVTRDDHALPPEFANLRIPRMARPMPTSDGEMVIYDTIAGTVALLYRAQYRPDIDAWSAAGGTIAYLASNGLDGRLPQSDEPRNTGTFRGYNGAVTAIRHDLVGLGAVEHVVKVGINNSSEDFVFPMTDSDGESDHPAAPAQGLRLRIKAEIDLGSVGLAPQARVIAQMLQEYGAVIADETGGPIELKLEDTVTEGRGQLWDLAKDALCAIPITDYEIVDPHFFAAG